MGMIQEDKVGGVLTALAGLGLMGVSARYPYWAQVTTGPGFFPLWLGAGLMLVGIGITLRSVFQARRIAASGAPATSGTSAACGTSEASGRTSPAPSRSVVASRPAENYRPMLSILAALVLFAILMEPVGALLTLLLFSVGSLKVFDQRPGYLSPVIGGVILTLVSYALFRMFLGVPLPAGWLGL